MLDLLIQVIDWFSVKYPTIFGAISVVALLFVFSFVMLFFLPIAGWMVLQDAYRTTKRFYRKDIIGPCKLCEHSSFLHGSNNYSCEAITCYCSRHEKMNNLDRIEHEAKSKKLLFWQV